MMSVDDGPAEDPVTAVLGPAFGRIEQDMESASGLTQKALAIIHARLHDPSLKAVDVREGVGGRRGEVSQVFRTDLGESIGSYIQERRLESAQHLLVETEAPVWTVAKMTGFQSGQHLARIFGRSVGCSPSKYRAEAKRELPPEILSWLTVKRGVTLNQLQAAVIICRLLVLYPAALEHLSGRES